jgi:Protein of unknown function (DUF1761)
MQRRKALRHAERHVMNFGGVDTWAIVLAAVAGYVVGAFWYTALSKPWMAAQGFTPESIKANRSPLPFILVFVANLVMAIALAGVIGHLGVGQVTLKNAVISAVAVWLGFIATTLAANYSFGRRRLKLYVIDAGHWLAVLIAQGIVIGAMGV